MILGYFFRMILRFRRQFRLWRPFSLLALACLGVPAGAAEFSDDELLFFGSGVDSPPAVKSAPPPKSVPAPAPAAKVPVKLNEGSLKVILLDAPKKSFATGSLASFSAKGEQRGTQFDPEMKFSKAGSEFDNALLHALVAVRGKNSQFPEGLRIDFNCDGSLGSHERDSTALAGAVLLNSFVTGNAVDPQIALVGGIGPGAVVTGAVGVGTRIRTLPEGTQLTLGVPLVAEPEVRDLALMGEPEVLLRCEVYGLVNLDDAIALASQKRPESLAKAHELFVSVRTACGATPVLTFLKNAKVQQRLAEIIQLAPGHLSAKLLLQTATNKLPGRMTFLTSQQAILKAVKPFLAAVNSNKPDDIRKFSISSGNTLNLMQARVHESVERYLVTTRKFMREYNTFLEINPSKQFTNMREKAWQTVLKLGEELKIEKAKLDQVK